MTKRQADIIIALLLAILGYHMMAAFPLESAGEEPNFRGSLVLLLYFAGSTFTILGLASAAVRFLRN